jgi:hypothetical protein
MRRRCGKPDQIETSNELQVVPTDTCHDFDVEVVRFDYRLADAMLSGFLKKVLARVIGKVFEVVPHFLAQQLEHCCGLAREAVRMQDVLGSEGGSLCAVPVESPPRCSPRS